MAALYPALDGFRIAEVDGPDIWLIFDGERHRFSSQAVYDSLFTDTSGVLFNAELDEIKIGFELDDGTCLIRFEGQNAIYLATGSGLGAHIIYVYSYETFLDFGFDFGKVREVPAILFDLIPKTGVLKSAPDRAARAA